jgi:hypothetical protein
MKKAKIKKPTIAKNGFKQRLLREKRVFNEKMK